MKKFVKIFVFMIAIIICLFNCTYGFELNQLDGTGGETGAIENTGKGILSIVSTIGSAISIIAIIALGIKYMLGSVEEKASYKKTLMPYFIGAIFVFGATTIPGIVYQMFNK